MNRITRIAILIAAISSVVASAQDPEKPAPVKREMLVARILVLDPDGHPLDGATITPFGMRTKVEPGSYWFWIEDTHGPKSKVVTNTEGIAEAPYPKYVSEKMETGMVTWAVEHPEYVAFMGDREVDANPAEITLARGLRIALTAVDASSGEPIRTDLYAILGIEGLMDWKLHDNGMLVSTVFAETSGILRVLKIAEGEPVLFSDAIDVKPDGGSRLLLKDVRLSKGKRVEGRIDQMVPRPIKNGYVTAAVVRASGPGNKRNIWLWSERTPIAEDGTFVFESLPPNEILQMIPVCDDWVPKKPDRESVLKFFPDQTRNLEFDARLPQLIELGEEEVHPVLKMEPATSARVTVLDPNGRPLPNATVWMTPVQIWFEFASQALGWTNSSRDSLVATRAGATIGPVPYKRFHTKTDDSGQAEIRNLPTGSTERIWIAHDDFELPIGDRGRTVSVELKPGIIAEVTVQLQKKGTEMLGDEKNDK